MGTTADGKAPTACVVTVLPASPPLLSSPLSSFCFALLLALPGPGRCLSPATSRAGTLPFVLCALSAFLWRGPRSSVGVSCPCSSCYSCSCSCSCSPEADLGVCFQRCSPSFSTSRTTPVPTVRPVTPTSRPPTSSSSPPAPTRP